MNFIQVLDEPGDRSRQVYFPVEGVISLVVAVDDNASIEIGTVDMPGLSMIPGVEFVPLRKVD